MFEVVKTIEQQKAFEETWEYFCEKYGWYNDPYSKIGVRYNLLIPNYNKSKKILGTIEFIPYDPNNPDSTVEGPNRFEFAKVEEVIAHKGRVWEIDKLCLHKDFHQRGYFSLFIKVFEHHVTTYQPKYYIALVEQKLYNKLKLLLGKYITQLGEPFKGPTTSLVPMMIAIEEISENTNAVSKFLKMVSMVDMNKNKTIFLKTWIRAMRRIITCLSYRIRSFKNKIRLTRSL